MSERRFRRDFGRSAQPNAQPDKDRIIRASEIGRYVYCAHAWWLGSVQGMPSSRQQEMEAGKVAHRRHGLGVRTALWLRRQAYIVLLLAVVVGVVELVNWMIDR